MSPTPSKKYAFPIERSIDLTFRLRWDPFGSIYYLTLFRPWFKLRPQRHHTTLQCSYTQTRFHYTDKVPFSKPHCPFLPTPTQLNQYLWNHPAILGSWHRKFNLKGRKLLVPWTILAQAFHETLWRLKYLRIRAYKEGQKGFKDGWLTARKPAICLYELRTRIIKRRAL